MKALITGISGAWTRAARIPGEKAHEVICPLDDAHRALEFYNYYVIQPSITFINPVDYEKNPLRETGQLVTDDFEYSSDSNPHFPSVSGLRELAAQCA